MKKAATVIGIAFASVSAAVLVFTGLVVVELAGVAHRRANRSTLDRIKIQPAQREAFEAALSEAEFKVLNVGPTLVTDRRR
jgi:hypothetical protein